MISTPSSPTGGEDVSMGNVSAQPTPTQIQTLLPGPIASLISLTTAASSLGLRIGGFVSTAAISGARIGTLTSFELARVVLEGLLARAGRDVVDSSLGSGGRLTAEALLEKILSTLHYSITQTSFLVSTGFQIGSTSVASGLAVSQFFLSALDAVLGDTETSKAVATIVVLIRKEFDNPETGAHGERVGLGDLLVGCTGFALLQRWTEKQRTVELEEKGATARVWDIVVVNEDAVAASDDQPSHDDEARPSSRGKRRPASFVSATGEYPAIGAIGDGVSFVSTNSSRAFGYDETFQAPDLAEQAFRQRLTEQLKPGTFVQLNAQSLTTDSVTVEVQGDPAAQVEAPPGFTLVATESQSQWDGSTKLVFQRKRKRRRHGTFEVPLEVQDSAVGGKQDERMLDLDDVNSQLATDQFIIEDDRLSEGRLLAMPAGESDETAHKSDTPQITANQKRLRAPLFPKPASDTQVAPAHESPPSNESDKKLPGTVDESEKNTPVRKAMSKNKSVKNLVEFWNRDKSKFASKRKTTAPTAAQPHVPLLAASTLVQRPRSPYAIAQTQSPNLDSESSALTQDRPNSRDHNLPNLNRHRLSLCSIESNSSERSMVLHSRHEEDHIDRRITSLHREGFIPGSYPLNKFSANILRFSRFALASYGSRFLRLTGSLKGDDQTRKSINTADIQEHHEFTSYARLPSSTVLLSSFADPEGGSNSKGNTDSGMLLVHYIAVDHESKAVVFTCRGTLGFEDVLTDMTADYDDIVWQEKRYQVHKGVLASAQRLLTLNDGRVVATIKAALEEFDDYGLVLCGHSLGGAVASVLALLLAEPNTTSAGAVSSFVTASRSYGHPFTIPPNRPMHAYAFGPAAVFSPPLQRATRGLITSIVYSQDIVPYLSLGVLRDFQAVALAFKTDQSNPKGEVRRRVWEGLCQGFKDRAGVGAFANAWVGEGFRQDDEDHWPWAALKSLRASMLAPKLMPPGEVFIVDSQPVLQRHAFVEASSSKDNREKVKTMSFRPATHVTVTHVRDVEKRFAEIRFGKGMFTDHFPARYESVLETLERGVGGW